MDGRKGGLLWAVSPSDGANGRLVLATTDGRVLCFAGRREHRPPPGNGLARDAAGAAKAHEHIQKLGLYGVVSVGPWPAGIDQWPHYPHDATNNAVAKDTDADPSGGPICLQSEASAIEFRNVTLEPLDK
jgi:hypothetical protein